MTIFVFDMGYSTAQKEGKKLIWKQKGFGSLSLREQFVL